MIIRIMVIDPEPRKPLEDVIVYQVPERSRAAELLVHMLETEGLEYTEVKSKPKKQKSKAQPDFKPLFNEEKSNG